MLHKEMFSLLLELEIEEGYQKTSRLIDCHLGELTIRIIINYFPSLSTQVYDWVQSPYSGSAGHPESLALEKQEQLCELQRDCALKI